MGGAAVPERGHERPAGGVRQVRREGAVQRLDLPFEQEAGVLDGPYGHQPFVPAVALERDLRRRPARVAAQGALGEAIACLHEGLAGRNGSTRLKSYGLARLADALTRQGEHEAALAAAREGLVGVEKTGHRQWEAELLRFEGVALCGLNRIEEGQSALEAALRVARGQQAKGNELRAATSLARLWRDHGKRQQARDLLAPVYGWFTEGFDTADLKEAKALLDELT